MPNPIQRMLRRASESVPGQRPIRLPWQEPTLGERTAETLDTLADSSVVAENRLNQLNDRVARRAREATRTSRAQRTLGEQVSVPRQQNVDMLAVPGAPLPRGGAQLTGSRAAESSMRDIAEAAEQAEWSAERAERAAHAATAASAQMASAFNRILRTRGEGTSRAVAEKESPSEVEIRVGEAAESPLIRAADAVARVLTAAGETVYDYSGGHYGLEPLEAGELRRERKREKRHAKPVAVIEGRYDGDKAKPSTRKGSRGPLLMATLAVGLAAVGIAYTQRGRLRPLLDQLMARVQGGSASTVTRIPARTPLATPTPTPAFDRVVSGKLIE